MSSEQPSGITILAARASARGVAQPGQIVAALEGMILRNQAYLARRKRQGIAGAYDVQLAQDIEAMAAAIVLIESLA